MSRGERSKKAPVHQVLQELQAIDALHRDDVRRAGRLIVATVVDAVGDQPALRPFLHYIALALPAVSGHHDTFLIGATASAGRSPARRAASRRISSATSI